jgi:hypothetical protein
MKVAIRLFTGQLVISSDAEVVAVILTDADKRNIASMAPDATVYAEFPDSADRVDVARWLDQLRREAMTSDSVMPTPEQPTEREQIKARLHEAGYDTHREHVFAGSLERIIDVVLTLIREAEARGETKGLERAARAVSRGKAHVMTFEPCDCAECRIRALIPQPDREGEPREFIFAHPFQGTAGSLCVRCGLPDLDPVHHVHGCSA